MGNDMLEIRRAGADTVNLVEMILQDAVLRLAGKGFKQWGLENVTWEALSLYYRPEDFYLAFADGVPAGTFALVDYDPDYWKEIPKAQSYFIHKLAVHRGFAGQGVADAMLRFAVEQAQKAGADALRLDCLATRPELCAFYEQRGFRFVGEKQLFDDYRGAFYVYPLSDMVSPAAFSEIL